MATLASAESLDVFGIVVGLLGGLALFLYGMHKLSDGLKAVAGDGMKTLLAKLTTNRFAAALTGAVVTAILQSSSITTVLVVGFVSAGLMTLAQTVGIIMGANVGTTITAQILAFNIEDYAWLMIAAGFASWSFSKRDYARDTGAMLMGLGMLFIGMAQMGTATGPLRTHEPFIELMQRMDNRLMAMLIGAVFTALVQSSSATIGIVIMLASQGYLSLEAGISLAIGAKIGTCVTAVLSGLGKSAEPRRVGVVHVLFNVLGAVMWFPFIDQLAAIAQAVSPVSAELTGTERLAAETPRQVANAISIFAIVNMCVMIWFVGPIARLAEWIVPERAVEEPTKVQPKYLDPALLTTPSLALDRVHLELQRLGEFVEGMLETAPAAVTEGTHQDLDRVVTQDDDVDDLYAAVLEYIQQLGREEMTHAESHRLEDYLHIAHDLESIGDLIETNLVAQGRRRIEEHLRFPDGEGGDVRAFYEAVHRALLDTLQALADTDHELAREIVGRKEPIQALADAATEQVAREAIADDAAGVRRLRIQMDVIEQIHRLFFHIRRIAKAIESEGKED